MFPPSGLIVEQIAKTCLVAPLAMKQRLTRARRAIVEVGDGRDHAIAVTTSVAEANHIRRELDSLTVT